MTTRKLLGPAIGAAVAATLAAARAPGAEPDPATGRLFADCVRQPRISVPAFHPARREPEDEP